MTSFIHFNGSIIASDDFRISPDNRGLRYGDGFFETMKARDGKILLEELHFARLFSSLQLLEFEVPEHFTYDYLREQLRELLLRNEHMAMARVRLMVFRGDGGLYDLTSQAPNLLIQSWALTVVSDLSPLTIGVFPDARKTCDLFSGIKSNNYLCYLMGARLAKKNGLDDALILNTQNRIAETTIANIFIVKDGVISTPPLSEGCVNGVYRRYLLEKLLYEQIVFNEAPVTMNMLLQADEVFITNAITGILPVKRCGDAVYGIEFTSELRARFNVM